MQKFLAVSAVFATCLVAFGQSRPAPAISSRRGSSSARLNVDEIVGRYMQAVGGREAWKKLHSRVSIGTIEINSMGLSGTVVIHEKAPNKVLTVVVIAGSAFRQGFDGTRGWAEDPVDGLREQSGLELVEAKREADFYGLFDLYNHYLKLTAVRMEKVDREAYLLEATLPEGGEPDKLYFDMQTGLPVRVVGMRHGPEGFVQLREDFSDYREVDGIELPFIISQVTSASEFTINISEVHHNVPLDDSEFLKPAVQ